MSVSTCPFGAGVGLPGGPSRLQSGLGLYLELSLTLAQQTEAKALLRNLRIFFMNAPGRSTIIKHWIIFKAGLSVQMGYS